MKPTIAVLLALLLAVVAGLFVQVIIKALVMNLDPDIVGIAIAILAGYWLFSEIRTPILKWLNKRFSK